MVGTRKKPSDGDLFPRGPAPTSTPRIRHRDGQVLFTPSKRARLTRPSADLPDAARLVATRHGAPLSAGKLTPGMTSLGVITRVSPTVVALALPSGIRAVAAGAELLVEEDRTSAFPVLRGGEDSGDSEAGSDSDAESGSESSEGDDTTSSPLWELVRVGQLVRVAVVSAEQNEAGKRVVRVSLKPDLVNVGMAPSRVLRKGFASYGAVRSVEDHGYVVTFGAHVPHTGFSPFAECEGGKGGERLRSGSPVEVIVEKGGSEGTRGKGLKGALVVRVSAQREKVLHAVIEKSEGLSYNELCAGMLVQARVAAVGAGGVALIAFGVFNMAVDAAHVPRRAGGEWEVETGKEVVARVLFVDAAQKRIGASLLECFVHEMTTRGVPRGWGVGTVLKRLKVERVKPGVGLVLRPYAAEEIGDRMIDEEEGGEEVVDPEVMGVPVFAHISRLADSKDVKLESKFHQGMKLRDGARVVSVSPFDGAVNVDLRPSILARKALSMEEIEVGTLYSCKILSHTAFGSLVVAVDGDPHLPGVVTAIHVSDASMTPTRLAKHPGFRVGTTVRCRALFVNEKKGKVFLSTKKSLTSPKFPLLKSYEQAEEALQMSRTDVESNDAIFTGSVSKVLPSGHLVAVFCDFVTGLVPKHELCLEFGSTDADLVSEVEKVYPVGQTIHVRVTKVQAKLRKMVLSMNLDIETRKYCVESLALGRLVGGVITGVNDAAKHFLVSVSAEADSGRSNVSPEDVEMSTSAKADPKNSKSSTVECHLPFGHLSDVLGMAECLVDEITSALTARETRRDAEPLALTELMVLAFGDGVPIVTAKDSLKEAMGASLLPKDFEEVKKTVEPVTKEGPILLRGYVKALLPSGAIVGFLGDSVGFVRISRIDDRFISDPARALQMNQSVSTCVESLDEEKKRFLLSIRPSDVGHGGIAADTQSLFGSQRMWMSVLGKPDVEKSFPPGSIQAAAIQDTDTHAQMFKLRSDGVEADGVALGTEDMRGMVSTADENVDVGNEGSRRPKKSGKQKSQKLSAGKVPVRVLDVDPFSGVVDLSRDEKIIAGGERKSVLQSGTTFEASVLLVKSTHIVLSVSRSKTRSAIAYALGPVVQDYLAIRPGTSLSCTIIDKSQSNPRRNLALVDWKSFLSTSKTRVPMNVGESAEFATTLAALQASSLITEDVPYGKELKGKVTRKFDLHDFVAVARGVVGHLHITNVAELSREEMASAPLGMLSPELATRFQLPEKGCEVSPGYVAGIRRTAGQQETDPVVVELALIRGRAHVPTFNVGDRVVGFVKSLSTRLAANGGGKDKEAHSHSLIAISPSTVACCADVDSIMAPGAGALRAGAPVLCQVISAAEDDGHRTWVTVSENGKNPTESVIGLVQHIKPGFGIRVRIPWFARDPSLKAMSWGTVSVCDVSTNFDDVAAVMDSLAPDDAIEVRKVVCSGVSATEKDAGIFLTMRKPSGLAKDRLLTPADVTGLTEGSKIRGFVRGVSKLGCFLTIGRGLTAQVLLCDLADEFVKLPEKEFPVGTVVEGVVGKTSSAKSEGRVSVILRKRPRKKLSEPPKVVDLDEGSRVSCTIKRIENYGALVTISGGVTALLHVSEIDQDRFVKNPHGEFVVGQKLEAIVIKVDGNKICVGTKRCYFEAIGLSAEEVDTILWRNDKSATQNTVENTSVTPIARSAEAEIENDGDEDKELVFEDENSANTVVVEDIDEHTSVGSRLTTGIEDDDAAVAPLGIAQGFDFVDATEEIEQGADPEDAAQEGIEETDKGQSAKRSSRDRREKKREKEAAETSIRLKEEALANNPDSPETAEDYERLLVGEPNSSVLWIRYMAFCLSLSQIDKARSVAERALETISLREEVDRTNVWIAYINLEAQFGASNAANDVDGDNLGVRRDAAVFRVFDRGCERVTDVKNFHLQAATALRQTDPALADEMLRRATRRFKGSKKVWLAKGLSEFVAGNESGARRTLERALVSLEKRKHIAVISKFAQLEYKHGSPERGRTVFESLAGNFPKRLDLWNIYLDMEVSLCSTGSEENQAVALERTRDLFERCTALDLSSKKMKFVFKKWLAFEKKYGDKEQKAAVKDRARAYVERTAAAA